MSELSLFMSSLVSKSKELESNISQSMANHHSLTGYAQAIKEVVSLLGPIVETIEPSSVPVVNTVEAVVDAVDSSVTEPAA